MIGRALLLVLVMATLAEKPPPARYHGYRTIMAMMMNRHMDGVLRDLDSWTPNDKRNIWELSGLHEGDIMEDDEPPIPGGEEGIERNAVTDHSLKWPAGVVPYYISEDFESDEADVIRGAMDDLQENSCVKFRPYRAGDAAWIMVQNDAPGCWSYVGRRFGGQVVNLGPRCVQHAVAAHEFLHALGFHHQQSASDRDNYVTIHWRNIRKGTERNFKKYSSWRITDFGVGYDYDSVMHYSTHAFSKNGKPTITPKDRFASIGQRSGLSSKDVSKLNVMYSCNSRYAKPTRNPYFDFWNFNFR